MGKSVMENSMHSWIITFDGFSKLPNAVGQQINSAPFKMGNYKFVVYIYPGGETEESKGYLSVYLELVRPRKAEFKFASSICSNSSKNLFEKSTSRTYIFDIDNGSVSFGWPKFVKCSTLVKDVVQSTGDQLMIMVKIYDLDVTDCSHQIEKLHGYELFLDDEQYSDIKITVGKETIYAHKIILINGNEVFAAMLEHETLESTKNVINIEDVKYNVMYELVRFIYIGEVYHLDKMAEELLIAADKYGIEVLKHKCGNYLCQILSNSNVVELLSFADTYNVEKLKESAITYFKDHHREIVNALQFRKSIEKMEIGLIVELMRILSTNA
ncbi:hypothetical protein QAD02_016688 [Eretmocerus hayati]|uniref:Uncharacterized protein n=1 Tax=Eretmocerus hayati TaxID=131215 RepID=A0ACC2PBS8_9HYME|nr:hypothetical protein QAD02_016688 [Eretmocerus hayati]